MPVSHTIDRRRRRVTTRATGLVTFAELWEHLDLEEADRAEGYAELFDACGARTNLTSAEIHRLVGRARRLQEQGLVVGPTAVVADNDLVFGMARMYAILAEFEQAPVEVFREVRPALRWLRAAPTSPPRSR